MYDLLTCFTCGQPIGHLHKIYKKLVEEFSENDIDFGDDNIKTPEAKAIHILSKKHGFDPRAYCCSIKIICNYDITNMVS